MEIVVSYKFLIMLVNCQKDDKVRSRISDVFGLNADVNINVHTNGTTKGNTITNINSYNNNKIRKG